MVTSKKKKHKKVPAENWTLKYIPNASATI